MSSIGWKFVGVEDIQPVDEVWCVGVEHIQPVDKVWCVGVEHFQPVDKVWCVGVEHFQPLQIGTKSNPASRIHNLVSYK